MTFESRALSNVEVSLLNNSGFQRTSTNVAGNSKMMLGEGDLRELRIDGYPVVF